MARFVSIAVVCLLLISFVGVAASSPDDPTTWEEWLLPLGDYTPGQPQAASCRLFVREMGDGPRIVFLHGGWGGEHGDLLRGFLPLADAYRLVFYDQRGSLRSPCDSLPTVTDHVEDLERLRVALGDEALILVGHSMGGYLGMAYAAAYPDRVRGLVLLDATPAKSGMSKRSDEKRWDRPAVRAELDKHALPVDRLPDQTFQEWSLNHRIIFGCLYLNDVTKWRQIRPPWSYAVDAGASAARSMPSPYDFTTALAQLVCNILVLHGDDDYIPVEGARAWTKEVPNARLVVVPNAGHFSWIDQPEVVVGAVRGYADHVVGARADH